MPRDVGLTAEQIAIAEGADPDKLARGLRLMEREREVPMRTAFRSHWRAVTWSVILSIALIMDGYDGYLLPSFYAHPDFLARFGKDFTDASGHTKKIIPAQWQTSLSLITLPGQILSLLFVGWAAERFGNRATYCFGMVVIIGVIFMFVFLKSYQMLLAAEALVAFCWGIFQTLTASYAADLCPIGLRGFATSFISMAWGTGSFLGAGVTRGSLQMHGVWGWRLPFALQWVFPVPLLITAILAPESPYWLIRKGRNEDAKKAIRRTARKGYYDEEDLDAYLAYIRHTDALEEIEARSASFMDMFKGTNRRRTEIMLGVWGNQQWSGYNLSGLATVFLKNAGMNATWAFNFGLIIASMNIVGCGLELAVINRISRRALLIGGQASLITILLLIGILGCLPSSTGVNKGLGALLAMINLVYHITLGPIVYSISAELPATRLRARSIALGRMFYLLLGAVQNQLVPRMIAPDSWNWGPKCAFFFAGINSLWTLWAFFRVPETSNRSYAELEILFANKVPARKFARTRVWDESAEAAGKSDPSDDECAKDGKGAVVTVVDVETEAPVVKK
ncbi:trehalose transport-related protein [Trichosporon asahii var. asahii CBS 8904]|uniref:Trehalose transport-related protein n=1 Tax=Trichosporon asahii var. asahii (strain CBS 8904) TaxID=1220162 RepID=K1WR50_TRIAC|nr:trehalose transport-related protein [Trichosporon asahii var. asahii CBS 8904]